MEYSEGIMTHEPTDLNMISLQLKSKIQGVDMIEHIALTNKHGASNAERICKTWNSHDELVALLTKISNIENEAFKLKSFSASSMKAEINQLLTKIK